jgi:hypothetical protein
MYQKTKYILFCLACKSQWSEFQLDAPKENGDCSHEHCRAKNSVIRKKNEFAAQ